MFDEVEEQWQEAVDTLDVKYIDGVAYMSVHTIDVINMSLMDIVGLASDLADEDEEAEVAQTIGGALWVMKVWKDVHDELELRSEVKGIPDTVPHDFLKEN